MSQGTTTSSSLRIEMMLLQYCILQFRKLLIVEKCFLYFNSFVVPDIYSSEVFDEWNKQKVDGRTEMEWSS
jgi:hypothetical protein